MVYSKRITARVSNSFAPYDNAFSSIVPKQSETYLHIALFRIIQAMIIITAVTCYVL